MPKQTKGLKLPLCHGEITLKRQGWTFTRLVTPTCGAIVSRLWRTGQVLERRLVFLAKLGFRGRFAPPA